MANVHKDFHGAMSYAFRFLAEQYGPAGQQEFLASLADTVYAPLVDDFRRRGLVALEEHWRAIFALEGGQFDLQNDGTTLVLQVHRCPAITHMQARGYPIAASFCEHTRLVNEAICQRAGYRCAVEYDQTRGQCVQRFWRTG